MADDGIVHTMAMPDVLEQLPPERRRICSLCQEPRTVAEIADQLSIPLALTRLLLAHLVVDGHVVITPATT